MRSIWMARMLSVIIISVSWALILANGISKRVGKYETTVQIQVNGNYGDIIEAIESLDREDIKIGTQSSPYSGESSILISATIGMAIGLSMILGLYHLILLLVMKLLGTERKDSFAGA